MANHPVHPDDLAPPVANYAHAVVSTATTRWLHTSGVVPVQPDGEVPADLIDQAKTIWTNIVSMLKAAEMSSDDIVSVVTYVVPGLDLAPVMAVRDEVLGSTLAASTLLVVAELAQPAWKMEIAIVAAC